MIFNFTCTCSCKYTQRVLCFNLCLLVLSADNLNICNQFVSQNVRPDLDSDCLTLIVLLKKNQQIYDKKNALEASLGGHKRFFFSNHA